MRVREIVKSELPRLILHMMPMVQEEGSISLVEILLDLLPSRSAAFVGESLAYFFLVEQEYQKCDSAGNTKSVCLGIIHKLFETVFNVKHDIFVSMDLEKDIDVDEFFNVVYPILGEEFTNIIQGYPPDQYPYMMERLLKKFDRKKIINPWDLKHRLEIVQNDMTCTLKYCEKGEKNGV